MLHISIRNFLVFCIVLFVSGCATHANISVPDLTPVANNSFDQKTFSTEILYSQPEPGVFSGGEEMELAQIDNAKLSVGAVRTLQNIKKRVQGQLPLGIIKAEHKGDYHLSVELYAFNKKGPAYADHEFLTSVGKGVLSLGMAPSDYTIYADFLVKYILSGGSGELFAKEYRVQDEAETQMGDFEGFSKLHETTRNMFEKHLVTSLHDFFEEASRLNNTVAAGK